MLQFLTDCEQIEPTTHIQWTARARMTHWNSYREFSHARAAFVCLCSSEQIKSSISTSYPTFLKHLPRTATFVSLTQGILKHLPQTSDRAIQPSFERSSDRPSKRSSDRAVERSSEPSSGPAIDGASTRAIEQTSDRAIERSSDRVSERSSDRAKRI